MLEYNKLRCKPAEYANTWEIIYKSLPGDEQRDVYAELKRYDDFSCLSSDSGLDLMNLRTFVTESPRLCASLKRHIGDWYTGEMIMGITVLCDYFNCSTFVAMKFWETGRAVPVFKNNMPYAIRMGSRDIRLYNDFSNSAVSDYITV